jgi:hypothetical protein
MASASECETRRFLSRWSWAPARHGCRPRRVPCVNRSDGDRYSYFSRSIKVLAASQMATTAGCLIRRSTVTA